MIRHVIRRTISSLMCTKMNLQEDAKTIFEAAVEAVRPETLLKKQLRLEGNKLRIKEKEYYIKKPCHVVGFGKAVLGMGMELEKILGDKINRGLCSVPKGISEMQENKDYTKSLSGTKNTRIQYLEGGHNNLPDNDAMNTASKILSLCEELAEDDFLIVLISGGGSALLPLPRNNITLEEKLLVIKELVKKGADIMELNCVRKKLSKVKGGGLAISAYPAKVVSLILSDVIGDPLDFIASGPTVRNSDHPADALGVIKRHGVYDFLPEAVLKILRDGGAASSGDYGHVDNFIIGNNETACLEAKICAEQLGYTTMITSTGVKGDVREIAKNYAVLAKTIITNENYTKPICMIAGGEPTVVLKGGGKGGRNQELALSLASELKDFNSGGFEIGFLSCGTDGIDGPTDAAGAFCYPGLFEDAECENLNAIKFLDDNDSYNFYAKFQNGKYLHKIGHTGTNVMDLHILLIK